ncbi:hypothetical protein OG558_34930 [Kribbella sp. NBC_01510]|uniref:hypothetical protein n=1 Tax=unclassified Kribbella TaxID=2644121 RepID=UPI002E34E8C3|nr:hypothetical protein [Kribbella sp. NBC_01484]
MGTQEEEARALAELERVRTENAIKEMQRQEELRKLQEQQNQNKMVADGPAAIGWPDNEVQAPPSRLDAVKGALGVGAPGDAAFAGRLLNDGRPPATDAVADTAGVQTDGAKERRGATVNTRAAQAFGR